MTTTSQHLTASQRVIFSRSACRWAIDQSTSLCVGVEVVSRSHWMGKETPEEAAIRARIADLAAHAPGRAKRICDYATLGPDGIDMKSDKDLAEVMDQLRTDEDTVVRARQPSSQIISGWVEKAISGEI